MPDGPEQPDPLRALREACDRNVPLSVVRSELAGRAPFANGRLISLSDGSIEVEDLRVIGREVYFSKGQELDAYFTLEGLTYSFSTRVIDSQQPVRLNRVTMVKGMTLSVPSRVELGQRRNSYRVSLAGAEERCSIELWRLRNQTRGDEEQEDGTPQAIEWPEHDEVMKATDARDADLSGWLADASDRGLGVVLEGVAASKLRVFEVVAIRLTLPNNPKAIVLAAEVRQVREVRDRLYRLGFVLIPDEMPADVRKSMRSLNDYLSHIQREELRRRKAG